MISAAAGQYATPKNLETRISIHDKYSVNKQGFGSWIFERYDLRPGMRILELGCGTGSMWRGKIEALPEGVELVLSDLSAGMVAAARKNLGEVPGIDYREIDIQRIPFPDASFDAVIANMMLYHVPDLTRGLAEVRRVLRPDGTFYCATFGEHGMANAVAEWFPEFCLTATGLNTFTLQNGAERLHSAFADVERRWYPDALRVTEVGDFVDYLYSLASLSGLRAEDRPRLTEALRKRMRNGALEVPKEYGMFVCRGAAYGQKWQKCDQMPEQ